MQPSVHYSTVAPAVRATGDRMIVDRALRDDADPIDISAPPAVYVVYNLVVWGPQSRHASELSKGGAP